MCGVKAKSSLYIINDKARKGMDIFKKISKLIAEKGDFIIDNLYLILHLLAKNFNHLDEINIELLFSTLDKHISNLNQKVSVY